MKNLKFCLLFLIIFLTACSSNVSKGTNKLDDNTNNSSQSSTKSSGDKSEEKQISSDDNTKDEAYSEQNISEKVKEYIINGQEDKSEAGKIKWSKTFLNRVDIKSLYKQYIANGGNADDVESFAMYITLNAPIQKDWEDLFKKDLYDTYEEKVVKLEPLQDDLYQAYVIKEGKEVPYVVVSARTGYFHG
ncbi:hypothetical protein [Clostridium sp. BL-8]|uniref:hypothetical protein n=1 Tax=Clostridium sp. BL-8 TaxID=349938 RepID=UPI00098CEF23|nr:hypothetical protein [Clostridium sp. BL-8]OOM69432.1 hypothetical protein CLOBL_52410 [Clostridium sp. BL-8]